MPMFQFLTKPHNKNQNLRLRLGRGKPRPFGGRQVHMEFDSLEYAGKAIKRFEKEFDEILVLMKDARSVELRLRIYFEVSQHRDFGKNANYEKYMMSKFKVDRKKINKIINDLIPDEETLKFQKIREILDPLAHSDYLKARNLINAFADKYEQLSPLNNNPFPERTIENMKSEGGAKLNFARLIESSKENLIMEEFLVFKHQGYVEFVKKLIEFVNSRLSNNSTLGWYYELLCLSRAIKFGKQF